jgi:hypothetical protein
LCILGPALLILITNLLQKYLLNTTVEYLVACLSRDLVVYFS